MAFSLTDLLFNYLFIQSAILLFIAPFYLAYKIQHPHSKLRHIHLNQHAEDFLSSPQANYLVFFWAAAEAVCWFVIPEFLLLLIIFLKIKSKVRLLVYDILGTAVGTVLGLVSSYYFSFPLTKIPYVSAGMVEQVGSWYQQFGVFALFFQPFSGVPYKVFVLSVHNFGINLLIFVLLAIIVRVARYYLIYSIFTGLYPFLHQFISKNYVPIFIISCLVFSMLFLRVYHKYDLPADSISSVTIPKS